MWIEVLAKKNFTSNPRCISHVDYWCTFSDVFHVDCFTWINGVPVRVDIRWISVSVGLCYVAVHTIVLSRHGCYHTTLWIFWGLARWKVRLRPTLVQNKQFQSVFNPTTHSTLSDMGPSSFPSMKKFKFTIPCILKLLQDIKIHKAPGPDKSVPRLLHDFAHILAEPLVEIFNKSLETSDVRMPVVSAPFLFGPFPVRPLTRSAP